MDLKLYRVQFDVIACIRESDDDEPICYTEASLRSLPVASLLKENGYTFADINGTILRPDGTSIYDDIESLDEPIENVIDLDPMSVEMLRRDFIGTAVAEISSRYFDEYLRKFDKFTQEECDSEDYIINTREQLCKFIDDAYKLAGSRNILIDNKYINRITNPDAMFSIEEVIAIKDNLTVAEQDRIADNVRVLAKYLAVFTRVSSENEFVKLLNAYDLSEFDYINIIQEMFKYGMPLIKNKIEYFRRYKISDIHTEKALANIRTSLRSTNLITREGEVSAKRFNTPEEFQMDVDTIQDETIQVDGLEDFDSDVMEYQAESPSGYFISFSDVNKIKSDLNSSSNPEEYLMPVTVYKKELVEVLEYAFIVKEGESNDSSRLLILKVYPHEGKILMTLGIKATETSTPRFVITQELFRVMFNDGFYGNLYLLRQPKDITVLSAINAVVLSRVRDTYDELKWDSHLKLLTENGFSTNAAISFLMMLAYEDNKEKEMKEMKDSGEKSEEKPEERAGFSTAIEDNSSKYVAPLFDISKALMPGPIKKALGLNEDASLIDLLDLLTIKASEDVVEFSDSEDESDGSIQGNIVNHYLNNLADSAIRFLEVKSKGRFFGSIATLSEHLRDDIESIIYGMYLSFISDHGENYKDFTLNQIFNVVEDYVYSEIFNIEFFLADRKNLTRSMANEFTKEFRNLTSAESLSYPIYITGLYKSMGFGDKLPYAVEAINLMTIMNNQRSLLNRSLLSFKSNAQMRLESKGFNISLLGLNQWMLESSYATTLFYFLMAIPGKVKVEYGDEITITRIDTRDAILSLPISLRRDEIYALKDYVYPIEISTYSDLLSTQLGYLSLSAPTADNRVINALNYRGLNNIINAQLTLDGPIFKKDSICHVDDLKDSIRELHSDVFNLSEEQVESRASYSVARILVKPLVLLFNNGASGPEKILHAKDMYDSKMMLSAVPREYTTAISLALLEGAKEDIVKHILHSKGKTSAVDAYPGSESELSSSPISRLYSSFFFSTASDGFDKNKSNLNFADMSTSALINEMMLEYVQEADKDRVSKFADRAKSIENVLFSDASEEELQFNPYAVYNSPENYTKEFESVKSYFLRSLFNLGQSLSKKYTLNKLAENGSITVVNEEGKSSTFYTNEAMASSYVENEKQSLFTHIPETLDLMRLAFSGNFERAINPTIMQYDSDYNWLELLTIGDSELSSEELNIKNIVKESMKVDYLTDVKQCYAEQEVVELSEPVIDKLNITFNAHDNELSRNVFSLLYNIPLDDPNTARTQVNEDVVHTSFRLNTSKKGVKELELSIITASSGLNKVVMNIDRIDSDVEDILTNIGIYKNVNNSRLLVGRKGVIKL